MEPTWNWLVTALNACCQSDNLGNKRRLLPICQAPTKFLSEWKVRYNELKTKEPTYTKPDREEVLGRLKEALEGLNSQNKSKSESKN